MTATLGEYSFSKYTDSSTVIVAKEGINIDPFIHHGIGSNYGTFINACIEHKEELEGN